VSRRYWGSAGFALFVALLIAGGWVAREVFPQKSFSVPRVEVEAELRADGSMRVVEHITYDFTGTFSYGTRPIPVGPYTLTDVSVHEHGAALVHAGDPYNLQWFFDATDEQRTFDVAYTVTGAVAVGPDVAELYWKWVGEDHPQIGTVTATLAVPPGAGELRAWGHGPPNGVVDVGADTVDWRANDVAQGTFVEGRVAVPRDRLPALAVTSPARLATILGQEQAWADAANARRRADAEAARETEDRRDLLTVVAALLTLLGMLGFFLVWRRWGREPATPTDIGEYVRELPDDPPAVVDALMAWGRVRPTAFSATVIDLAQRGYLTIAETTEDRFLLPDRSDYRFERTELEPDVGELRRYEERALEQIFATGSVTTQSEITRHAGAHQKESQAFWRSFQSNVASDLRIRKYVNGGRAAPFVFNVAIALVVGLVGVAAIGARAYVSGIVAVAWAAAQLALTPLMRQRSARGQRRWAEWQGVRRYLHDFSALDEAPAGHLALWERYLVYAVALGVSDELAQGIAMRLPAEETPRYARWWIPLRPAAGVGGIGSFGVGFASASVAAFTPASSGSGSGGGFSGGGGGGGGGGGIGAG